METGELPLNLLMAMLTLSITKIITEDIKMMHNPPHPGKVLNDLYLEPLELSVTATAKALTVTRVALSEIIHGKRSITTKTAIKLSKAFNTTPQLWLNMQQQYDLWQQSQSYQPDDVEVLHCA